MNIYFSHADIIHATIVTTVTITYITNPANILLMANANPPECMHTKSHASIDSRHNIRSTRLTVMFIALTNTVTNRTATDTAYTNHYLSTLTKPL